MRDLVFDLLFDIPFWLPTLLVAAGIVLFVFGNNRGNTRLRAGGLVVVGVAILLCVVSYFVMTPKERALANTRKLVNSFQKQDWATFESSMPEHIGLGLLNYPRTIYSNRTDLVAGAKDAQQKYNFKAIVITSIDAAQTDTLIGVNLDVLTEQDITMGRPIPSSWRFDYQETAQGWVLTTITALKIANQQVDQIRPMFPKSQ